MSRFRQRRAFFMAVLHQPVMDRLCAMLPALRPTDQQLYERDRSVDVFTGDFIRQRRQHVLPPRRVGASVTPNPNPNDLIARPCLDQREACVPGLPDEPLAEQLCMVITPLVWRLSIDFTI